MTAKDYIAIAGAFQDSLGGLAGTGTNPGAGLLRATANRIADVMAADNPRFDRDRFLTACGFAQ